MRNLAVTHTLIKKKGGMSGLPITKNIVEKIINMSKGA